MNRKRAEILVSTLHKQCECLIRIQTAMGSFRWGPGTFTVTDFRAMLAMIQELKEEIMREEIYDDGDDSTL